MGDYFKIRDQSAKHFITFAVVDWVDVFTRKLYRDIVVDSLKYCQENRGLVVHSWTIMSNHVHFILSARNNDLSNVMRDFKKFTASQIIMAIRNNERESRKEWMLAIFKRNARENPKNEEYQFWQQDNMPKECHSPEFTLQKLLYIHANPVKAGIVAKAEDYLYSSARDYKERKNVGLLEVEFV